VKLMRFFLIPLSLGLFACASNEPKPPTTSDTFVTLIQGDGSKQFSYTLIMELPERTGRPPRGGKGPDGPGGPPPGGPGKRERGMPSPDRDEALQEQLRYLTEESLLAKLEDTGYCRSGYHTLETQARRGAMNIVGECTEKATEEDRQTFPNPPPKKVIEERLD